MIERFALHVGDCREVLRGMVADSVDAIVTDPPYHLTAGKKGGTGPASLNENSPAGRARIGTGFMGMAWDGGDVAMRPETWAAALRVAKPGAHLLAFGGTRTFHRIMIAVEDAGWEIRDTIMWVYGSGFPKSHNGEWGGTALKPAWEPIIVARKPLAGTVAENFGRFGTGALNIAGCRVDTDGEQLHAGAGGVPCRHDPATPRGREDQASAARCYAESGATSFAALPGPRGGDPLGRWPANLIHDGSAEVLAVFPDAPGQMGNVTGDEPSAPARNTYGTFARTVASNLRADSGSAARFFYCAKASREDRNEGCEALDAKSVHGPSGDDRVWDIPGSNSTPRANNHPTVKPVELMRYLCRLVTPPGGLIVDMFGGSGSTGKAAMLENFRFVGMDLSADYVEIARLRIAHAAAQPKQEALFA